MKFPKFLTIILLVVFVLFAATPAFALQGDPQPPLFDMVAISQALQNLLVLVLTAAAGALVRWLNAKWQVEKADLSDWQRHALEIFLRTAVYAAEQMKASEYIDNKLDYVTELAEMWLSARGLDMDIDELRARIEAVVKEELNTPDPAPAG